MIAPWQILHLDLGADIPALSYNPDFGGVYAVFWWQGVPLCHLEISALVLPMSATQLENLVWQKITPAVEHHLSDQSTPHIDFNTLMALNKPLSQLSQRWLQPESTASISVVICTRDRASLLARCLSSLQNLSQPPLEIVVVDNAPKSDATRQLVEQMPNVRYVLEPRPGLDIARNTGIDHSTGDIIAFTDDDVTVHPNWLIRLQQSFHDPKVMAVTGLVLAAELDTEAQFIFEKYWSFNRGYCDRTFDSHYFELHKSCGVPAWFIGAGANMAFRRQVFELVGNFDERLDVGAAGCSGDSEFWYRVLAQGWSCRYEPTAVTYHYHRRDLDSLKQQMYYYMRGHVAALLIQFEKYRHWGNLRRLFLTLPKQYTKKILRLLFRGSKPESSTLLAEISGCVSGVQFYLQNRHASQLLHTKLNSLPNTATADNSPLLSRAKK